MRPIIIISGPTAAGKTAAAMDLYDHAPVRLINADSQQVYRGMDVGTAKPDAAMLAKYPHALIDIRDPEESYSVSDFVSEASQVIEQSYRQGLWPVLVGGTPLYLQALLYGLDELPSADPAIRQALREQAETIGWSGLHRQLQAIDPKSAQKILPSDAQRIQRALEIHRLTGAVPSDLMTHNRQPKYLSFRAVITPADRSVLHQRIEQRFDDMLKRGFMDEVRCLMRRPNLTQSHGAMKSIGYRQTWQHLLSPQGDLDTLRASVCAATRQLAKRQLTALRKLSQTLWYDAQSPQMVEQMRHSVVRWIEKTGAGERPQMTS